MANSSDHDEQCGDAVQGRGARRGAATPVVGVATQRRPKTIVVRDVPLRARLALFLAEDRRAPRAGGRGVLAPESASVGGAGRRGPATVVIRNIPVRSNLANLIATVYASRFQGEFEYLYLPVKQHDPTRNRGYVLVRFALTRGAQEFCKAMGGCRVTGRKSDRAIQAEICQTNVPLSDLRTAEDMVVFEDERSEFGPVLTGSGLL